MIPDSVRQWCRSEGYGEVVVQRSVSGGCINNGMIIRAKNGTCFFVKTNTNAPADMFAREVEGLQALRDAGGPYVPQPLAFGDDFLLMEDLAPARRNADYWEEFGRQLAALHGRTNDRFGFTHDNFIGSTPQLNPWMEDGYAFFAEARLRFQAQLARERGLLSPTDVRLVDKVAGHLREIVPDQPASLIHGDLWSGNAVSDSAGNPALIDPAVHYGWAEAELAMTALFGAFPDEFYDAYREMRPIERGLRDRFPLYNLYHLLNHLNLFGGGYYGQAMAAARRFA